MPTIVFKKGHVVIHPDILASMDLSRNEEYPQMSLFHIFEMAKWPTLCCSIPILSNEAISYSPCAHPVPQAAAKGLLAGLNKKKAKSKAKAKAVPVPKKDEAGDGGSCWSPDRLAKFRNFVLQPSLGVIHCNCHGNKPIKWRARAVFQEKGCLWPDNSTKSDHARLTKRILHGQPSTINLLSELDPCVSSLNFLSSTEYYRNNLLAWIWSPSLLFW